VFVARIRTSSRLYVGLDIVEAEPMKTDQIVVDLNTLTNDIREQGTIADYLKKNPQQSFYVVGHSDTAGSYEHNVNLSQRRAQAVAAMLTSKYAVAKPRLTAVGVGPVAPTGTNANDAGRTRNRRVELVLR
jgi:OmpA-OmpF porin, OOP family